MVIFRIECELNGRKLRVYTNGKIESFCRNKWLLLNGHASTDYTNHTCVRIKISSKTYLAHRVIYWAWNPEKFDINNPEQQIDHKNRNSTDNRLCNLDVVNNQQNQFNSNAKGYWFDSYKKYTKPWRAGIRFNNKNIHLGRYTTKDEARTAYINAKNKYHAIPNRPSWA